MAAIPTLPTVDPNATLDELRDQVAILQKTITFYLTSNLGSQNAYEFGGWLIGADSLMSEDGTVGMSSAETAGVDDVRFWAGDIAPTNAPYHVTKSGAVYTSNIHITGGSITWNAINPPTPTDVGALPVNSPKLTNLSSIGDYLGSLAQGQVVGLPGKVTYIGPSGIYSGVVGTDQLIAQNALIGDALIGTLSANKISTVGLAAEKIYQPGSAQNYAVIGGSYGDMILNYNNAEYFKVYNNTDGMALYSYGRQFLAANSSSTIGTFPIGKWDFLNATVQNINVTAKFG